MPTSKGLKVQQSRFAALALETSSESEEERGGGEWETVKKASHKAGSAKQTQKKLGDGHEVESKPLSKNAKKRARKKRQQQAVSEMTAPGNNCKGEGKLPGDAVKGVEPPLWHKKNEEIVEQEFQKDLEQAILLSKLESERNEKEPMQSPVDLQFFSRLGQDVKTELKREKDLERRADERQQQSPSLAEDLPRIAQLQNEVENRDKAISKLKKDNETLKKALKEVKERNKSLCHILSEGEISSKAKLLQQIEELTTVKNELTTEVETLHTSLEQERSKNKTLKAELTKLQGNKGIKSSS